MKLATPTRKAEVKLEESNGVQVIATKISICPKEGRKYKDFGGYFWGLIVLIVLMGAPLTVHQKMELEAIKEHVQRLEESIIKIEMGEHRRQKRQAVETNEINDINLNNLSEDGVPILERKRKNGRKVNRHGRTGGAGFRVYDAWFQHRRENEIPNDPRVVWSQPSDSPIRAHHRKSASWVTRQDEEDYDDLSLFNKKPRKHQDNDDLSLFSKKITEKRKHNANTITHSRNRVKVTNMKEYEAKEFKTSPTPETTTPTTTTIRPETTSLSVAPAELNAHMQSVQMRAARNRGATRSGDRHHRRGRRKHRNRSGVRSSSRSGITGKSAIHMQGVVADTSSPDYEGSGRFKIKDGIFYDWEPARWARRMKMDKQFPYKSGKLSVSQPGVYFVYAQINYLDEHDVNAFQIYVNDSPFLLCTTMTHTPHHTTKANTCYTGGAVFLEQGDQIYIKNLETNRFVVLLPSHTFFGLVQLSEAGI